MARMIRSATCLAIACLLILITAPGTGVAETTLQGALHWRLVGPHRAGWSTTAVGVPGKPNVFYFGGADGGVWRTGDSGHTWQPLFSDQAVASVGALAIASDNPNILYAGTGQVAPRYDISAGAGVYRSTDGGHSWQDMGLADSRHIGRILVDPHDADTVLVAALGHLFGPNPERGVFRTSDGGKHWTRVLFVNNQTGAVDLSFDPADPNVVYAAMWQLRRYPWQAYFTPPLGPGSGIYKSTDEGRTWHALQGHGLPQSPMGRIGLAVAPGSSGAKVYALINAAQQSGLYRSMDGGDSWQLVNDDSSLTDWYFGRLTVDPSAPDTVYVMGRSVRRSTDGGRHFTYVKGAPGGDDYHDMWIDPADPQHMILASDQGTTISMNGGRTWSSWYNQPTGQFYHLATDDRFPYWIYSGQQDSGTVGIASRSDYGQITFRDWHPVGGDERDYDIPDPGNPDIVYGSGLGGRISRWDARTGQVQNVSPWPVSSYAARPTSVRFRYTWITPLVATQTQPHALYFGNQYLFRSVDQGDHWQKISPDLTGKQANARDCSGDVAVAHATACGYGVIFSIAPSPLDADEIWVGTDNGRVELTRDAGRHWTDVTPPAVADWSKIAKIDISASTAGTAYIAVDRHRLDDFRPYIYRTHDYGKHWNEITRGLPAHGFVNAVRQDRLAGDLLFAGTSSGVYVSYDDGAHWHSLQLNLPTSGVNDLLEKGNDLIAATQGRAIWVLDDVSPLRQLAAAERAGEPYLFTPATAYRVRPNSNRDTPLPPETPTGQNPPVGAVIDYYLPTRPSGAVELQIFGPDGKPVAEFSSEHTPERPPADRYFDADWLQPLKPLPAGTGLNRFVWNVRYPPVPAIEYSYSIAAVPGENTPAEPEGAYVLPGTYTVELKADGKTRTQQLDVKLDPRVTVPGKDLADLLELQRRIGSDLQEVVATFHAMQAAQSRLHPEKNPADAARSRELDALMSSETGHSFASISSELAGVEADLESADRAPTQSQRAVVETYEGYLRDAQRRWQRLSRDLPAGPNT